MDEAQLSSKDATKGITLKPCPFCGRNHGLCIKSISHLIDDVTVEQWSVFCDTTGDKVGCGASCGYYFTREEAIRAWNRRAEDERIG